MSAYAIVTMEERHLPAVLDIYNYYVMNTTATFHAQPLSLDEMRQVVFFDDPRYQSYVIQDTAGKLCGYAILMQYKKRQAYDRTAEVSVYLTPDCPGRGLGSMALQHIEQTAWQRDIHVLLGVVCGENQPSRDLFIRNGYQQCAHLREVGTKFDRILDIIFYQKILTDRGETHADSG
mgnify:CR=1 FL=1